MRTAHGDAQSAWDAQSEWDAQSTWDAQSAWECHSVVLSEHMAKMSTLSGFWECAC